MWSKLGKYISYTCVFKKNVNSESLGCCDWKGVECAFSAGFLLPLLESVQAALDLLLVSEYSPKTSQEGEHNVLGPLQVDRFRLGSA